MIKLVDHKDDLKLTTPVIKGGSADLSNYYTKTETDEAIDNAVAAIPQPDLTDYAKKSELFSKDYNDLTNKPTIPSIDGLATTQYVDEKVPSLDGYALKTDIPDVSGFITEIPDEYVTDTELDAKGYLTQHQSLADYAKKSEIPDVSAYQTETQVQALINTAIGSITDGNEVSY